ncbi:MAG TPA: hypothetical protein V6C97_18760 [Oculatellaceae cyanobacterium]
MTQENNVRTTRRKICVLVAVYLLVVLIQATVVKCLAAPAVKTPPPPPDYFPLRVNDWWKYKTISSTGVTSGFEIKVISADKQSDGTSVFQTDTIAAATAHDWYTKPKGLVVHTRQKYGDNDKMQVEYQPPYTILKNPPVKDDTWQYTGKGMLNIDINDSATVIGPEEVWVPAGKFEATKIVSNIVQNGAKITKTCWYANWIGLVKMTTELSNNIKNTSELVDYSFKKPESQPK